MSNAPTGNSMGKPRFTLALAGLVLILISPVFWGLTLDNKFLQRTALMMWLAMAVGLACAVLGAYTDRRKRTRVVAALAACWVLFSIPGVSFFTRLPAPTEIAGSEPIADFTLPDHHGRKTALSGLLRDGWVLLVFYRGYW
ncbi:MAG: hypothetical protein PVI86_12040 [Phycisphaerae bacterium]|jgi:hypothetical protein